MNTQTLVEMPSPSKDDKTALRKLITFPSLGKVAKALAVVILLLPTAVAYGQTGSHAVFFKALGDLDGGEFSSGAKGISQDGTVAVGNATSASGVRVFRWTEATGMVDLGDIPGGTNSYERGNTCAGVSSDGSVVAGRGSSLDAVPYEAFRWTQETGMVGLGSIIPGRPILFSTAYGISANGTVIVGGGHPMAGLGDYEASRWTQETGMVGLGDFPDGIFSSVSRAVSADGTVIVGSGVGASGMEAFRWTEATGLVGLGDLPGGTYRSEAFGVSADNSVIVGISSSDRSDHYEAMLWTEADGMVGLGDLPGGEFYSFANGVNADGSIVTGWATTQLGREAFIWDTVHGMRNLKDVFVSEYGFDLTGWRLTGARISDDGTHFFGGGVNPSGNSEAWIATIPEPSTLILTALGLLSLAFYGWRRRKSGWVI